jgi:hypothetical protein
LSIHGRGRRCETRGSSHGTLPMKRGGSCCGLGGCGIEHSHGRCRRGKVARGGLLMQWLSISSCRRRWSGQGTARKGIVRDIAPRRCHATHRRHATGKGIGAIVQGWWCRRPARSRSSSTGATRRIRVQIQTHSIARCGWGWQMTGMDIHVPVFFLQVLVRTATVKTVGLNAAPSLQNGRRRSTSARIGVLLLR